MREILKCSASNKGETVKPQINSFDTVPDNLNPPETLGVNTPKREISDDVKHQLLTELHAMDNGYLTEKGGGGFDMEFQDLLLRNANAFVLLEALGWVIPRLKLS